MARIALVCEPPDGGAAEHVAQLTPERARAIGEAARQRILAEHTYARRAVEADALIRQEAAAKRERSLA